MLTRFEQLRRRLKLAVKRDQAIRWTLVFPTRVSVFVPENAGFNNHRPSSFRTVSSGTDYFTRFARQLAATASSFSRLRG